MKSACKGSSVHQAYPITWSRTLAASRSLCIVIIVFFFFGPVAVPAAKGKGGHHEQAGSKSQILGDFEGRKVLVHSSAEILLKSALRSEYFRSVEDENDNDEDRLPYLIRVKPPCKSSLLKNLFTAAGKGNIQYIPHDAYLATLKRSDVERIGRDDGVVGIFHMPDALKLEPDLYPALDSRTAHSYPGDAPPGISTPRRQQHVPEDKAEAARQSLRSLMGDQVTSLHVLVMRRSSAEEKEKLVELIRDQLSKTAFATHTNLTSGSEKKLVFSIENEWFEEAVVWISEQSWALWVGLRPTFVSLNYYGARAMQNPCEGDCRTTGTVMDGASETEIWNKGLKGQGQVVGFADTGVDLDSCYFKDGDGQWPKFCAGSGAMPNCVNFATRKVISYRAFRNRQTDYSDHYGGHGTHVAGSIAGNFLIDEETPGYSKYNGAAPEAKLCIDDVDDRSSTALEIPDDLEFEMFPHSYENCGARIHTNSWGVASSAVAGAYTGYSMDVDSFAYDHDDALILFAAGNSGAAAGTVAPPSTAKNSLSVGATNTFWERMQQISASAPAGTSPNQVASFSSRGPTVDGRIKPDVSCVGSEVLSAMSNPTITRCPLNYYGATEIQSESGTSMATPLCAGGAALVRQYFTEGWWLGGTNNSGSAVSPTSALLKAMLINSATTQYLTYWDENGVETTQTAPDPVVGFGRVELSQVLWFGSSTPHFNLSFVNRGAVEHGIFRQYCVQSTGKMRVTLVWTDPPSFPNAAKTLVNNLDLVVITPSGAQLRGNAKTASDPADDVNNAEHVTVDASEPGLYLIRVLGTELPFYSEPGQTFALVLVGELEESDQCDADGYVDGAPAWVVLCDQGRVDYTGFNLPADVSLPAGRNLQVLSATDAFVVERGFYAVYNAPGYVTTGCGVDVSVTSEVGELMATTPSCSWIVSPGVNFEVMQAEWHDAVTFQECIDPGCTSFLPGVTGSNFSASLGYGARVSVDSASGLVRILHTTSQVFQSSEAACASEGDGMLVTDSWGVITDGAGNLTNSAYCRWTIAPAGGGAIHLEFKDFAFESDFDFLSISNCSNSTAKLFRNFTSNPGVGSDGTTAAPTPAPTTAAQTTTAASTTTPAPFPNPPADIAGCSLTQTWPELQGQMIAEMELPVASKTVRTGGLGKYQEIGAFEVYVCVWTHACAEPGDPICFVYHEQDNVFLPWGRSSDLGIYAFQT
mmetsp:Transcript_60667/g.142865  ORF Transcript_60667/g.142865 Transcript_60667/m.142865 type:complete len:1206 (-) Transcript_60667:1091-4708(-)